MKCIQSIDEIRENMVVIDRYLERKCDREYSFALSLIKRGTCFIAAKTKDGYKFYPSRFIGYADNTMDKHLNNEQKDGRVTNPAISKALDQALSCDPKIEKEYRDYCERLGFIANDKGTYGVERKYWVLW